MADAILDIYNHALVRLGHDRLDSITQDSDTRRTLDAIYDQVLEETTTSGPELGWKFARRTEHGIDIDSTTITAFASASATTTTVSGTHTLAAGDMVVITGTTSYDGTYDVVSISTTVSFVITKVFVADDATGKAKWTSEKYAYRYAIPTSLRVIKTLVGGIELPDWIREGVYVLTNMEESEVDIQYVKSITTTTLFPPHFTKVLWFSLAIEAAFGQIQSATAPEKLRLEYDERILPKAIAMDEREKHVQEESSSWVDAGRTRFTFE